MMKKTVFTTALTATALITITAFAATPNKNAVVERLNAGESVNYSEIADMIDFDEELYLEDGTRVPVVFLHGGITVDTDGYECMDLGEGTFKLKDGQLAYKQNPVMLAGEWVAY